MKAKRCLQVISLCDTPSTGTTKTNLFVWSLFFQTKDKTDKFLLLIKYANKSFVGFAIVLHRKMVLPAFTDNTFYNSKSFLGGKQSLTIFYLKCTTEWVGGGLRLRVYCLKKTTILAIVNDKAFRSVKKVCSEEILCKLHRCEQPAIKQSNAINCIVK